MAAVVVAAAVLAGCAAAQGDPAAAASSTAVVGAWAGERARVEAWVRGGNGTVSFLHVHKGGGTTMCSLARANGMVTQKNVPHSGAWAGHNCNPTKEDVFAASKGLPEAAVAFAARMRRTGAVRAAASRGPRARSLFYANEGRAPAALAFGSFAFVGVVRDWVRRDRVHLHFNMSWTTVSGS